MTTKSPDLETISLEQFLDAFVANEVDKWKCYANQTAFMLNSPDYYYRADNPVHEKAASQLKTVLGYAENDRECFLIFRIWPKGSISVEGHVYCVELHEHKEPKSSQEQILEFIQEAIPVLSIVEDMRGRMKADQKRTFLKFDVVGGGHRFVKESDILNFDHIKGDVYTVTYKEHQLEQRFEGSLASSLHFNINDIFVKEATTAEPSAN